MCMPVGRFGGGVVSSAESLTTVRCRSLACQKRRAIVSFDERLAERIPQRRVKLFCSQEMRARSEGEGREDRVVLR